MEPQFSRTERLIGTDAVNILKSSAVAVFGIGGVGSFAAEALARAGVGKLCLVDNDTINESNLNRQIIALHSTLGQKKALAAKSRISDINPAAEVTALCEFYNEQTAGMIDLESFDYIIDAIDTVTSKLLLIQNAKKCNTPIISSMGTGNKLNPSLFEITDISKTSVCPLARVMRRELKARGIQKLKVIYSKEPPIVPKTYEPLPEGKRQIPASISFVPSVAGLMAAGEVIKDLIGNFDVQKKDSF